MKRKVFIFIGILFPLLLFGTNGPEREVRRSYEEWQGNEELLDSIEERWGIEQEVPATYRRSFLIALSAFPELQDVSIRFQEEDLKTSMAAQPVPTSLLGPRSDRAYRILVDTLARNSEGKLFKALDLDARIGIMAHELAHILDYVKRDIGGMIRYGVRYLSGAGRKDLEARTDRTAIDRGFGWQLLAFKEHLREEADLAPSYQAYKERIYLSHQDLRSVLDSHPDYNLSSSAQL